MDPKSRYEKRYKGKEAVTFVVASYLADERRLMAAACMLQSLRAQTHPGWEAHVVHDGPCLAATKSRLLAMAENDPRVSFVETPKRLQHFGHPHRHPALAAVKTKYVTLTNDDIYLAPVFVDWALDDLERQDAGFLHVHMVHSHRGWRALATRAATHHIDIGCAVIRTNLARAIPWPTAGQAYNADGRWLEHVARKAKRVLALGRLLYVHN